MRSDSILPRDPEAAFVLGLLFQRLGGSFAIASNGKRYIGRMFEPVHESAIPQLPGAEPHQRLLNTEQWEGAMRVIESGLSSLHPDDRTFLFDVFASVAVDDRQFTPSIEEPRRRVK
jgi:hypothetical protein